MDVKAKLAVVIVALTLMFVCQCSRRPSAPVYKKDGKVYGLTEGAFRNRWWHYYERGLSYAEGEFYKDALADFRQAIDRRERDQRRARTYGMHLIDYFPHRELGIVYYRQGKLNSARRELETSLAQWPTAKATYFLDLVRKGLIERANKDVTPPRLFIDLPSGIFWTRDDPVIISGQARDEQYVAAVKVGAQSVFLDGSREEVAFETPLFLVEGRHVIRVEAKNLFGQVTKREVVVHVDRHGPLITLTEVEMQKTSDGKGVKISGYLYDEAGVEKLFVNGAEVLVDGGVEVFFEVDRLIHQDAVTLSATDRLGNRTKGEFIVQPTPRGGAYPLLACAKNEFASLVLTRFFGSTDDEAPRIDLEDWTEAQTVYLDKIYLEGRAQDAGGITELRINGESVLRREGRHIFFGHVVELDPGDNEITFEAEDEAGNVATQTIHVERKIPKALQLDQRLSVSVLPFHHSGLISETSLAFHADLSHALMKRNRFQLIERQDLDLVLEEQKLSLSKVIDESTALRLGKVVAAQCIFLGAIIESRAGLEIVGRMIDTETSETLAIEDVFMEMKSDEDLMALSEGLAIKIHRQFPLVDGVILESDAESIVTDMGRQEVKLGRRLIVYRERIVKHPKTHVAVGYINDILDHARVTQVMPNTSRARLRHDKDHDAKALDRVITQ